MELLYIYIEDDQRNIKNCEFNFSPEYRFQYDRASNALLKTDIDCIHNFWEADNIRNITAVIGKNGSGKSNLLEYISLALCGGLKRRGFRLLVWIYKDKIFANHEIIANFHIEEYDRFLYSPLANITDKGINDSLLLYYSTNIDRKIIPDSNQANNFKDISNGNLIRIAKNYKEIYHRYPDVDYMQILDTFKQILFLSNFGDRFLPRGITIPEYLEVQFNWYEDYELSKLKIIDDNALFEKKLNGILHPIGFGLNESKLSLYDELVKLYHNGDIKCELNRLVGIRRGKDFKFSIRRSAINNKIITALAEYYFQHGYNNATFSSMEWPKSTVNNNCIIKWSGLSSGEVSFYTLLSRIFSALMSKHSEIFNGGSYEVNLVRDSKYKNVVLILDEPEISFHPEWQQKFISLLINSLGHVFSEFKFQIILASHSPIIVSDFPNDNLIFLKRDEFGMCKVLNSIGIENTFAANIHSLYRNSFFLDGLPIGDFAKSKILRLFSKIKDCEISDKLLMEIECIGEPLIKDQLLNLYKDKCSKKERIRLLEKELQQLKNSND